MKRPAPGRNVLPREGPHRHVTRSGAFKPLIDRTYPFVRIAEAHTGRKRGNVVITLD